MSQLARAGDARLALAARSAPDGQVIQFLAGAPELLARYRNAPPAAAALIDAAMDARRLGMGAGLPQAFLEAAAPGYLTDDQWDALGEDWLEQALAYTAVPCKGARGPLTRIRPRPARPRRPRPRGPARAAWLPPRGRCTGSRTTWTSTAGRTAPSQIPPAEFWAAAAAHAAPGDQAALGDAAHARGLYRDAAQLHKNAAASGNPRAVLYLSHPPACLRADPRPAHWAAAHAPSTTRAPWPACWTACGRRARTSRPPRCWPATAAHAPLDDPDGVARLLDSLREAGADEQAAALLARDPPPTPPSTTRTAWPACWTACGRRARDEQAAALAGPGRRPRPPRRPGRRGPPAGQPAGGGRARAGRRAGRPGTAAHAPLDDPGGVARLLDSLREAGAHEQAAALAGPGPPPTPPSTTRTAWPACWTACGRRARHEQAAALAGRAAAHAALDDPGAVASLLDSLREAGADEQAAALAARAAAHAPLDDPGAVARLLDSLREAGAHEQAAALAGRAAAHAALDDPGGVARLLDSLREAGAHEQAAALLARDPAAHAALDDPDAVARLLDSLRRGGRARAGRRAGQRAAAHAPLDDPGGVAGPAGQPAGGGRARAGRRADRPAAGGRHVRAVPRASRAAGIGSGSAGRLTAAPSGPWGWDDLD